METRSDIGVIFDCDGTLLDSMGMWHSLDDRIAERAGVQLTQADRDYFTQATLRECGDYIHERYGFGASGAAVEQLIAGEIMHWYADEVVLKPGAASFVRGLAEAGVPMAVASSTPAAFLREGLNNAGLAPYMRAIVSVEDVRSSKREPLVYDTARAALGTERAVTWGVEDAAYALRTLRAAGYRTMSVFDNDIAGTPEQLKETSDLFVASFTELTAERFLAIAYAGQDKTHA
ncbi:HAD family hydrolase [Adlercreutzia murintestinalis]|uniref:HAD family hydrolase n=1 Tax=Adlercreutzia murintestinalis TaxID=2941325 RepID=UPI00203D7E7F|nr:HAD family phosphatase [Adlercreutzia murintestinalis]